MSTKEQDQELSETIEIWEAIEGNDQLVVWLKELQRHRQAAERIALCLKACDGIPSDVLEAGSVNMLDVYAARVNSTMWQGEAVKAQKQRDELLAALESLLHEEGGTISMAAGNPKAVAARDAIARAKGGAV